MASEKEMQKFRQVCESMSVTFKDFIVIARTSDSLLWRASDSTWALGATTRYQESLGNEDLINEMQKLERQEDAE